MSTHTSARRAGPPLLAMVGYTLRSCLPRRRWVGILIPAAAALVFGLLSTTIRDDAALAFADVAASALFALVLPVTSLVVGDAVLGAEVRSGTLAYTWMAPVPTWQIAVGRWFGGSIAAGAVLSVAFAASAIIAGAPQSAAPAAVAAVFGALAYVAVFVAIGSIARRTAVWSLAFVFLIERLLGRALAGVAQLSPSWEAGAAFAGLSDSRAALVHDAIPQGAAALVRLCVIAAVALLAASWRLRHLRLAGSSD